MSGGMLFLWLSFHRVIILLLIVCTGVGQVVLQVAAATPCKYSFGIEKSFWPALYAKVTVLPVLVLSDSRTVVWCTV